MNGLTRADCDVAEMTNRDRSAADLHVANGPLPRLDTIEPIAVVTWTVV